MRLMSRWGLTIRASRVYLAAASILLPVLLGLLVLAPSAEASNFLRGVRFLNLHSAYTAALPHVKRYPISGIVYTRSHHPARSAAPRGSACSEPACPLVYHGGPVQHSPHVYLLLWGPHWSSDSSQAGVASYLQSFYQGLGTRSDTWSTTTSQYSDSTGVPTFTGSVFMGTFSDTTTPPSGVDQNQLAAEADAFATSQGITDLIDAQIIIATQSGTCPNGFGGCGNTGDYCAWHSFSNETYTNLPYLLDAGNGGQDCGANSVNSGSAGTDDGFSIVGGHEYAETITDPQPDSGWIDLPDTGSGGEIGDKCAWNPLTNNVTLSTGTFAMQPLWSNSANGCVLSSGPPPPSATVSTSVYDGSTSAAWSGSETAGATAYDTATVSGTSGGPTPAGTVTYSFFANGSCTSPAVSSGQVTMSGGSVPNSSVTSALAPGSYSFRASYSGDSNYLRATGTCEPFSVGRSTQAPLTITSTTGTAGVPLGLTTTGGSDGGTVSYVVNTSQPAGCVVSGSTLSAARAGTCVITGTMAGNTNYNPVSSSPTMITFSASPGQLAVILSPLHPAPGGLYTLRLTGRALSGGTYGAAHNQSEVDVYEEAVSLACAPSRAAEAARVVSRTAVKAVTFDVASGPFSDSQQRRALSGQHQSVRFCGYLSLSPSVTTAASTASYTTT